MTKKAIAEFVSRLTSMHEWFPVLMASSLSVQVFYRLTIPIIRDTVL